MSWTPPRRSAPGRPDTRRVRPRTLLDRIWDAHLSVGLADGSDSPTSGPDALEVDRILLHEHQLGLLGRAALAPAQPARFAERVVVCSDQQMPTSDDHTDGPRLDAQLLASVDRLERASDLTGIPVFGPGDHRGGVVNVVAAEQGMVLPGDVVVAADAHVSTFGALGALALVVADGEVPAIVAEGCVARERPGVVRLGVSGSLAADAGPKDLALWLLGRLGPGAVHRKIVELGGPVIRALSVESRMTLCNVAVESGALAVVIAPDQAVVDYLAGRPFVPDGQTWNPRFDHWSSLVSDHDAEIDGDLGLIADRIAPQVTWGTDPDQVAPLDGVVPDPRPEAAGDRDRRALVDQGLEPGRPLREVEVDQVFIGSCANARIEDLRAAADVVRGARAHVPAWVVPGSWPVRRQAEAEGLHRVFLDAGFEWRSPGCSLCIGANGDAVAPGARLASTANRPTRGLAGPRARIHLLGPTAAAATALTGRLTAPGDVAR